MNLEGARRMLEVDEYLSSYKVIAGLNEETNGSVAREEGTEAE